MAEQYSLKDFIAEMRALAAKRLAAGETLGAISPSFKKLLDNREFLQRELDSHPVDGDEACLYEDPDYHFVILARGIRQGKSHAGSPHDHGSLWALYGIYEGSAHFQRYELDPSSQEGPFPGLRKLSDRPAKAGDFDAIEPGNMHLPLFPPDGRNVIIVVYDGGLDSVVRRGYLREIQQPVRFQGQFPSRDNRVNQPL